MEKATKRKWIYTLLVIPLMLISCAGKKPAVQVLRQEKIVPEHAKGMEAILTSQSKAYKLGEPIELKLVLKNNNDYLVLYEDNTFKSRTPFKIISADGSLVTFIGPPRSVGIN